MQNLVYPWYAKVDPKTDRLYYVSQNGPGNSWISLWELPYNTPVANHFVIMQYNKRKQMELQRNNLLKQQQEYFRQQQAQLRKKEEQKRQQSSMLQQQLERKKQNELKEMQQKMEKMVNKNKSRCRITTIGSRVTAKLCDDCYFELKSNCVVCGNSCSKSKFFGKLCVLCGFGLRANECSQCKQYIKHGKPALLCYDCGFGLNNDSCCAKG